MVRTGPGKPGIFFWHFPGLEKATFLERSGNLYNSAIKYEMYGKH